MPPSTVARRLRLLVVNQYYPPDASSTATNVADLAEYLARSHDVTVLCGRPSYDPWERHPYYLARREPRGGVAVLRVGSTAFNRRRWAGRLLNYLTFLALAALHARRQRADVVVSMTDPPMVAAVAALATRGGRAGFVYNLRDFHPDMALAAGVVRAGVMARAWDWMHREVMLRADCVVVLGRDMRLRVGQKGVSLDRVRVVHNNLPLPGVVPGRGDPRVEEARLGFPFLACHAGNLGFYGAWDTLLEAAERVRGRGIGLLFVGVGVAMRELEGQARRRGLDHVRFQPYRPQAEALVTLAAPDLHVVTIRRGIEGYVVPSKLYPILAAGRPVLVVGSEDCEPALVVRERKCGLVADPDDPAAVADALRWAAANPQALREMGARAREAAALYTPEQQLAAFQGIVEEVAAGYGSAAGPQASLPPGVAA